MKAKFLIIALFALLFGVANADAQVRQRAIKQHHRIKQGVKSGELTRAEALNLRKNQKDLRQDARLAKSDGKVTRNERKILRKEQRKDSRKIYRKKHNNRERH